MHHYGSMYYNKKTAVVLYNNIYDDSPEDVIDNKTQADWISKVLSDIGYSVIKMQFTPDCVGDLHHIKYRYNDLTVVNMVDSAPGEENLAYLVPAFLDFLKIRYTGCSHSAIFLTTNKVFAKKLLYENNINTPDWYYGNDNSRFRSDIKYIIKALSEDSSIGLYDNSVVSVKSLTKLKQLIDYHEKKDNKPYYAENYIDGREFNVCIYGKQTKPVILQPYEWTFEGFDEREKVKIINYDAKWTEGTYEYEHINAVYNLPYADHGMMSELKKIAKKCWDLFELNGYARVDFRIDKEGKIWVLEINCNPSFYGFRNIACHMGLDFKEILKCIVEATMTDNEIFLGSELYESKGNKF